MDDQEVARYWDENAPEWIRGVRAGYDLYRDYLNSPAFLSMLPELSGKRVLDVGCGEGYNTRIFGKLCGEIVGIDVSEAMINAARKAEADEPLGIEYYVTPGNDLSPFEDSSFDAVLSTMAMMDMADYAGCIRECARVLKSGGVLQFSSLHPITMTRYWKWIENEEGERIGVIVGNYFGLQPTKPGDEVEEWFFASAPPEVRSKARPFRIPCFFRTFTEYFNPLPEAGFHVVCVKEPYADEMTAKECPYVADTRIVPLFMIMQCRKQ